jgi:hypothetical protein
MWRLVAPFTIPHVNHLLKGHHADFRFAHINPKKVTRRERGTYLSLTIHRIDSTTIDS